MEADKQETGKQEPPAVAQDVAMDTKDAKPAVSELLPQPLATPAAIADSGAAKPEPVASAAPVSDLAVAAQYADLEIQSVSAQFASASMESAAVPVPTVPSSSKDNDSSSDSESDAGDNAVDDKKPQSTAEDSESDSDDSDEESDESRAKLRANIEEAMEKEDATTGGPLTTANEVVQVPVREANVELTADCPIAQCGSILNASVAGLMLTIKSNANAKPLAEGSVLCLEDRTVLGCVDEVFGPVLMPMYVVRFESASKMPAKAVQDVAVYYATEHVSYIVPDEIKDKGTDASNIFDEETDEVVYSDDEAEAAAKRGNRKRNRGGARVPHSGSENGGRGGRGGRGNAHSNYGPRQPNAPAPYAGHAVHTGPPAVQFQTEAYGGVTKYTQPHAGSFNAPRPPMIYGSTNYTSPQGYGAPQPPLPPYNPMGMQQFQAPPPYPAHNLPPYPPQAPPPQGQYQQYQQYPPSNPAYAGQQYQRQQVHQGGQPANASGYYGANGQQPPQPPLPRGPYDPQNYQ